MLKLNNDTTIKGFPQICFNAATEGIVLLKNERNVLPIKETETVSVFGRCQLDYYRSGTGSGGAVNVQYAINAIEGLRNKNVSINEELVKEYENFIKENPFDNGGGGWAQEPWFQKEMPLSDELVKKATISSQKALIIIGRTAGEDKDNAATEGGYYITKQEEEMIQIVTKHFKDVVIILNVGNIIDMSFSEKYRDQLPSILYAWHGGMEGGNSLAEIVCGNTSPSGKLAGTIANDIENYPSHKNFGDERNNYYEEDIYVGYRYFETFQKDQVIYPFGFGLSYTTFKLSLVEETVTNTDITLKIRVQNTGNYAGKEVVQIYSNAPQGELGKPHLELKAFQKTRTLLPNDYQHVTIAIKKNELSSYDDSGVTGYKSAYVLEKGTYNIYFGNSVRDVALGTTFDLAETMVTEQLSECMAPLNDLQRMKPVNQNDTYQITYENVPTRTVDLEKRIIDNLPTEIKQTDKEFIKLLDVYNNKATLEEFVSQLSVKELVLLVRGEGMSHPLVTPGTAAAFGGLYDELRRYGIPAACAADGPSGLRMDSGHKATQMPIGSLLACTWNVPLMEELYTFEGQELKKNQVDTLLGPGLNIHRHPLCGRNFEYFSEDPLLSGKFSKAAIVGMKNGGAEGTLKHYVANDQEKQRHHINAVVSERALREIHLKPFEIAVKEGNAKSIMTAYNPINNIQAASNYDLNTTILRSEWGFDGLVMTDWWAIMNENVNGGNAERKLSQYMIRSQNDVYMVFPNYGGKKNAHNDDLEEAVLNKTLTKAELQRSAMNILRFILNTEAVHREITDLEVITIKPIQTKDEIVSIEKHIFNTKENSTVTYEVLEDTTYTIAIDMRSSLSELAQSACNVILNNELIYTVQLNGNGNKWTREHITKINLKKGHYKLDLDFTKPGLEIGSILFIEV